MIMMMNHHHVILSMFLTALVRNSNNVYRLPSSSSLSPCTRIPPPPHVGLLLGITVSSSSSSSLVQNKHNNHPQPYHGRSRLTCLRGAVSASNTADTAATTAPVVRPRAVEGGKPQHGQPQSLLKAETTTLGSHNNTTKTTMTTTTTLGGGGPFMDRVRQLLAFRQQHGHCLVPKRYIENPSLGTWVNKQRQEYKRYQLGKKPCALTPERIHLLESIGMCWDASSSSATTNKHSPHSTTPSFLSSSSTLHEHHEDSDNDDEEEHSWQKEYQEVKKYMQVHKITSVMDLPRQSSSFVWIKRQREKYGKLAVVVNLGVGQKNDETRDHHHQKQSGLGYNETTIMMQTTTDATTIRKRIQQLSALDCDWYMSRRQAIWELRFRELKTYYEQYGDCCVPISYKASPQLAHWVSNQRKLYNQSKKRQQQQQQIQDKHQLHQNHHHQPSTTISASTTTTTSTRQQQQQQHYGSTTMTNGMTDERLARLQSLNFVWNRWDYEFAKKR